MTLILTVARPNAVYQSSDFQLTTPNGTVVSDADGTKQIQMSLKGLHIQVALTGLARFIGVRTIDLLQDALSKQIEPDLGKICASLAARCEIEMAGKPLGLTVVLAASDAKKGTFFGRISTY